jgi:hypothetical protein
MDIRELTRDEWTSFFNAFSRHYRGLPVTVELDSAHPPQVVAKNMPLAGITAECQGATVVAIEVIVGESSNERLAHVVRDPVKVRIAQVTGGTDELLIIESAAGMTTRIDFSPGGLERVWSSGTAATDPAEMI